MICDAIFRAEGNEEDGLDESESVAMDKLSRSRQNIAEGENKAATSIMTEEVVHLFFSFFFFFFHVLFFFHRSMAIPAYYPIAIGRRKIYR